LHSFLFFENYGKFVPVKKNQKNQK